MVGEQGDRMVCALEIVAPVVQGMDDSKELLIINVIASFSRGECLGQIHTGVKITIIILLHKNSPTSQEGGVSHDDKGRLVGHSGCNWQ